MYRSDGDNERLKRIEEKLNQLEKGGVPAARMFGNEYKSKRTVWGLPLVHIAHGIDPATGRPRVARGIFAMGNIAFGVFAFGGIAFGLIAFGGIALGLAVFGGLAVGLGLGIGGMATGYIALGGMAVGYYAIGGLALGAHTLGGNAQDPAFIELLNSLLRKIGGRPLPY